MKRKNSIILFITFLFIIGIQGKLVAQDDDSVNYQDTAPITETINNLINQDLEGAAQNFLGDLFSSIPFLNDLGSALQGVTEDLLDFKIPSTERIKVIVNQNIEDLSSSTESFENSPDSLPIAEEVYNTVVRATIVDVVEETSLSDDAQERIAEVTQFVQGATDKNIELAEESQTLDVTQQIMQNVSDQLASSATIQNVLVGQNQEAQVSRAMSNLLQAQVADAIEGANAQSRRDRAGSSQQLQQYWGLVRVPGLED